MKKKKLTINALAGSNLKTRKKQYFIMMVGVILAMVFSSSVVLYLFSSVETCKQQAIEDFGTQDSIVYVFDKDESFYKQAKKAGALTDYGISHIIGYAYNDEEILGTSVAWLDDKAKEISNIILLDGEYPTRENEIAVEKTALNKLGIDAEIGNEITLKVKTQNDNDYYDTNTISYKLVGIVSDKKSNYQNRVSNDCNNEMAAAFVAQGTDTAPGGKEKIVAYVNYEISALDGSSPFYDYFAANTEDYIRLPGASYSAGTVFSSISENSYFGVIIVLVFIFACCVAIINSFNTNLKERKKQIGMMRAVGATKRQIVNIFGREAFFIALICTPVSILISYGMVWGIITLANEKAIMTKSIAVLPVCAVVCLVVTMLASLLPLISASKITPIQAIRDIDNTRKMKTKKIKSKKNFNVASHLAKRNLTFYKGGLVAVSVILAVTIFFSCYGFSLIGHELGEVYSRDVDYTVYTGSWKSGFINEGFDGMSNADKYNIDSMPYVSRAYGEKRVQAIVETDEFTDYHKITSASIFGDIFKEDENLTYENYAEKCFSEYTNDYIELKNEFGFSKEVFNLSLIGTETEIIKNLDVCVIEGSIHPDKIASGEEVVLVAKPKMKLQVRLDDNGGRSYGTLSGNENADKNYQIVLEGENPYKAGDALNISTIVYNEYSGEYTKVDKEAVIGAIIDTTDSGYYFDNFSLLTSIHGIDNFCNNVKYNEVDIYVDEEIDDDMDTFLTNSLGTIAEKYDGYTISDYANMKYQRYNQMQFFISMLAIIIVGFTICASIVNNTLTASIREKKKTIGTLRAVGASERDLVMSYIKQILSMFSWGYGFGFGIFTIIYLFIFAKFKYEQATISNFDGEFYLAFSPWVTIAFCMILFAICSINLWIKIRKEMKNSIIDNIREL